MRKIKNYLELLITQKSMEADKEIWKEVDGYEGLYKVSSYGNVLSLKYCGSNRKHLLAPNPDHKGYLMVYLSKRGKRKTFKVHRLVASAFIPNPHNLPQVNHKDENKQNNHADNLEWCDSAYNVNYGTANNRRVETIKKSGWQPEHMEKLHAKNRIPVLMIHPQTGNVLKRYKCGQEAAIENNINKSSIYQVCKHIRKTAGGYIWRYEHLLGKTDDCDDYYKTWE
jgi:hypothetical protein